MKPSILCEIKWEYVIAIMSLIVSLVVSIGTMVITSKIANKSRLVDVITSNRVEWMQKFKDYISKYSTMTSYYYDKKMPSNSAEFINELYELTAQIKLHLNYKGKADLVIINLIDEINTAFEKILLLKKTMNKDEKYTISDEMIELYSYYYPDVFAPMMQQVIKENGAQIEDINSLKVMISKIKADSEMTRQLVYKQVEVIDKDIKSNIKTLKSGHKKLIILTQIYLKTEWERIKEEAKTGSVADFDFDKHYEKNRKEKEMELSE